MVASWHTLPMFASRTICQETSTVYIANLRKLYEGGLQDYMNIFRSNTLSILS